MAEDVQGKIPILLLKTKSAPVDAYEEYFSTFEESRYEPLFVPVLEHRFKQDALEEVRKQLIHGCFTKSDAGGQLSYGSIIFTSQRAVEAFARIIQDIRKEDGPLLDSCLPESIPLYVVGPATARGLKALDLPCPILGEETGNGEALSSFILQHYNSLYPGIENPRILFLVGEKRRDVIPKTLQSEDLPPEKRSQVHEVVIYETGEMQSFKTNFSSLWSENVRVGKKRQWIVVFSPTGCRAMLESLDLLDVETGRARPSTSPRTILIATIGPTTRDYLVNEFGFTPDVCAAQPSPEGIAEGIRSFNARHE